MALDVEENKFNATNSFLIEEVETLIIRVMQIQRIIPRDFVRSLCDNAFAGNFLRAILPPPP